MGGVENEFDDFVDNATNKLKIEIYSVVEGVVSGDLMDECTERSFNELLLKKHYAEIAEEPRESMANHQGRMHWKCASYSNSLINSMNETQVNGEWSPSRFMNPPIVNPETAIYMTLRGPNSPLEMSFNTLCRGANLKKAQVDGTSVNCVALDNEPFNSCARVMVAASVGVAYRTGNLVARDTTLMPAVPGLLSLLILIFAPRIEFRTDERRTKYTGCVAGLGMDSRKVPVYADHDMELVFDVEIDDEDVRMANSVRLMCNMLLKDNSAKYKTIEGLRERIRKELLRFVKRDREYMDQKWTRKEHAWGQMPAEYLITPDEDVHSDDVFSLHNGVILQEKKKETASNEEYRPR